MKKLAYINGVAIVVDEIEIIENKGEELDFGVMRIPFSNQKQNYQIGDRVKIIINDGLSAIYYDEMMIVSDKVNRVSKVTELYEHTVTFIESIKKYEKKLGSSIAITQPLVGAKHSLLDVLNLIRNKKPFERTSLHNSTRLFEINATLTTYLSNIKAPQFFFEGKSIRDMLNDVASYVNAIARIKDDIASTDDNELIFDFYNNILTSLLDIDEDVVSWELNADFKNFGTTVELNLENTVMSDNIARGAIVYPSTNDWISPRATKQKLQDTQYEFRLDGKIFEMGTVLAYVKTDIDPENLGALTELNITNRVKNKDVWDRLDLDPDSIFSGANRPLDDYKSNTLYWEYNKDNISNDDLFGVDGLSNTFENIIRRALVETYGNDNAFVSQPLEEFLIRVKYIPYFDLKMRKQKADANDVGVDMQITLNQGSRLTSGDRISKNAHGYIERVGNDDIRVKKYVTELSKIYNLGDYFKENGTFILAKRKLKYNIYDVDCNYEFSKNFNRVANFINIDMEDRQFDIIINEKQVKRNEIYEEFIELDVNPKTNDTLLTPFGVETFMNTFRSTRSLDNLGSIRDRFAPGTADNQSVDFATFYSNEIADNDVLFYGGIRRKLGKIGEGNSLTFSWGFETPTKVGDKLISDGYFDGITYIDAEVNSNVFYTDANGELENFQMAFHRQTDINPLETAILSRANRLPVTYVPDVCVIGGYGRSLFGPDMLEANDSFKVYKDRAETLGMTYSLSVVPHYQWVDTFLIGNKAIKDNNLIFELSNTEALYVWTSDTETYINSTDNMIAKGTQSISDYALIKQGSTYDTYTYSIQVDSLITNGKASWGLANSSGELYLGVNQTTQNISEVFFNPKNKRTNIKYRFDNQPIVAETPPEMPINLTFTNLLKTGFTANWIDNSVASTNFAYEVLDDTLSVVQSGTVPIGTLTKTITGLTSGKEYTFKIKTIRGILESNYASGLVTTEPPIPISPTGGNITSIGSSSFTMNWTDNAEYEDGYRIYIRPNSDPEFAYYGSASKNAISSSISGLIASTTYFVRVYAYNTSEGVLQESLTFADASATTTSPAPPSSSTPTILSVTSTETSISFNVRNNDASTATIYADYNDTTPDRTTVSSVASGGLTSTITYSGLTPGDPGPTYTIYATAEASGESVSSPDSYSQKLVDAIIPSAPSSCTLTATGRYSVSIAWSNVANETGYFWQLSTSAVFSTIVASGNVGVDVLSKSVSNLSAGTTYYARVKATGTWSDSGYTGSNNATTDPEIIPATPSGITAQPSDIDSITVQWNDLSDNETGFRVQISTSIVFSTITSQIVKLANSEIHTFTGLTRNTDYYVRVRAENAVGNSSYIQTSTPTRTL